MTGKNFFNASVDSYRLMIRNAIKYSSILTLGGVIMNYSNIVFPIFR